MNARELVAELYARASTSASRERTDGHGRVSTGSSSPEPASKIGERERELIAKHQAPVDRVLGSF
jgi:hypothetical protein